MDTIPLVNELVDDGGRLIQSLAEEGIAIIAACWVKPIEQDRWSLFLATPLVDERGVPEAYREIYRVLRSLEPSHLSDSDINLVGANDPITRDALDIRERFGGRLPTRSKRPQFGDLAVEETYVYPPPMSPRVTNNVVNQAFGNLSSLPENIRETYMWLCQDMVSLNQKWDFYQGLFGKPENFVVFDLAPLAFKIIAESLTNDLVMSIGRLGGPAGTDSPVNLSLAMLVNFYEHDSLLKALFANFQSISAPLRDYQDKLINHSDFKSRLGSHDIQIAQPKTHNIVLAITAAEAVLKHVATRYGGTDIGFGKGMFTMASSDALIYWLKRAWDRRFDIPSSPSS